MKNDLIQNMAPNAKRSAAFTIVLGAIAAGSAAVVLLDAAASENTKKRFRDSCAFYGTPLFETAPDRLGYAIGKPGRVCAAVAKGSLGDKLHALAQQG